MQHLEGSGTPVLYIGRTVLKGLNNCQKPNGISVQVCSATGRLVSQTVVYSRFVLLEVEHFSNCTFCVVKRVLIIDFLCNK
jgi:hypothetical protein